MKSNVTSWPITDEMAAERLHSTVKRIRILARAQGVGRVMGRRLLLWEEDYNAIVEALPRPVPRRVWNPAQPAPVPADRKYRSALALAENLARKPKKRRRVTRRSQPP